MSDRDNKNPIQAIKKFFSKSHRALGRRERLSRYTEMAPAEFWLVLFMIVPLCIIAVYSFWKMEMGNLISEWTIQNYKAIVTAKNGMYIRLLFKSLGMAGAITIGSVVLAYPIAYHVSFRAGGYKYAWLLACNAPFMVSWVILVFGWEIVLGYDGLVNTILVNIGLIQEPLRGLIDNMWAVIFVLIMGWTSWLVFPIFVSLEKINEDLLEAAADLGATPFETFRKITFPLSVPGVVVAIFFVLIPSFGEFVTPNLIGGTSGVMYANGIDSAIYEAANWPLGTALGILLLAIAMATAIIILRIAGIETLRESL